MITPLVSFENFEQFENALRASLLLGGGSFYTDETVRNARRLYSIGLPPIVSYGSFALLLGVSPHLVVAMTHSPERYWRVFDLPKRSGGTRRIAAPRVFLKTIQRLIKTTVLDKAEPHPCVYGFNAGRGTVGHARRHLRARFLLSVDIQDFFPSISWQQVQTVFANFGFSGAVPALLADLCTRRKMFPQGAPTSPQLSNLIFRPADDQISSLCAEESIIYSRYADDLTFSGESRASLQALVPAIKKVLGTLGFELNNRKTRLHGPGEAKRVTGLVVNEKVQVDRKTRRLLRAKFYNLGVKPIDQGDIACLRGWASYVNTYDKDLAAHYFEKLNSLE